MEKTKQLVLSCICAISSINATSQIQLPAIFSDGMVLQQNSQVDIWGWGNPSEELKLVAEWQPKDTIRVIVDNQGRWNTKMPTQGAGGPYNVEIIGIWESRRISDVMLGEVWLCSGQSNMEWSADMGIKNGEQEVANAACPSIHIFHVPKQGSNYPQEDCQAKWEEATPQSMRRTSATAYFFARYLTEQLNVPVGILVSAWGGTPAEVWTPAEIIHKDTMLAGNYLTASPWWPVTPGVLYNRMIHPLIPYRIAGCIWYQGESNRENPAHYARLVAKMVNSWRENFGWNFPFYYVQIAPHTYQSGDNGPALIREQQQIMLDSVENAAMINVSDLVDNIQDIHPRNKRAIGERMAYLAMDKVYGHFTQPYESPRMIATRLENRNIIIEFDSNFEKLASTTKSITGVIITDINGEQFAANAYIKGKQLIIPVKKHKAPFQVFYCFDDATIGSLRTEAGLPVLPFRTSKIE